jgi:hypothetical protein
VSRKKQLSHRSKSKRPKSNNLIQVVVGVSIPRYYNQKAGTDQLIRRPS